MARHRSRFASYVRQILNLPRDTTMFSKHAKRTRMKAQQQTAQQPGEEDAIVVVTVTPADLMRTKSNDIAAAAAAAHIDVHGDAGGRKKHCAAMQRRNADLRDVTSVHTTGDETAFSGTLVEDIWHKLTFELSVVSLLALELALELALIVATATVLTAVETVEQWHVPTANVLTTKLMLALTTVRLSTDSVFGWTPRPPSSVAEVFVIAVEGWAHWVLLLITGTVIVARALHPLQQLTFAHDAVVSDSQLLIRFMVMRPRIKLVQAQVRLQHVDRNGKYTDLRLAGGLDAYAMVASTYPTVIRHVVDEGSPLHVSRGGADGTRAIVVSVVGIDVHSGVQVAEGMCYWSPKHRHLRNAWHGAITSCTDPGDPLTRWALSREHVPRIMFKARYKSMFLMGQPDGKLDVNLDHFSALVEARGDISPV
ncbi:hypothetical protein PPROV_000123300 [Pycnococcus provasolii]|uniref:Inward rectifier potassium channel C-terminal domain-containing protein n=1 Tax=Pycnococcus provasolii TaxID=41880 RepID=A0A830H5L5_9CHLO|nr:hypothetical protein PPROV_000123300 [Pycnococcus provasolii]